MVVIEEASSGMRFRSIMYLICLVAVHQALHRQPRRARNSTRLVRLNIFISYIYEGLSHLKRLCSFFDKIGAWSYEEGNYTTGRTNTVSYPAYPFAQVNNASGNGFWDIGSFNQLFSMSFLASFFTSQSFWSGFGFIILGFLVESGRRLTQWLMDRFNFRFSVTARLDEGDPAYEWVLLFLTDQGIWSRTRDFVVTAKNSQRKWGVQPSPDIDENAEYVPTYETPQLFKWKGYWVEVRRSGSTNSQLRHPGMELSGQTIFITIYTLNVQVLSKFIAEAREGYKEVSRPHLTVYTTSEFHIMRGRSIAWDSAKHKAKRPLSSIILPEGVLESLIQDIQEFIKKEQWYLDAGIPYRRGYLLHGPPGTGKTSTIYALAGELGLEVYTLSLSSSYVNDSYLEKAASSIPKNSIFLIEDIDCAFPSPRDAEDEDDKPFSMPNYGMGVPMMSIPKGPRSNVTMSGLLNVLDGIASDEGKLFFATTNYVDHLDTALCRPGRIDRKIQYFHTNRPQAVGLFLRFYDRPGGTLPDVGSDEKSPAPLDLQALAKDFAAVIPEHEFSVAELQSFLLGHKQQPQSAVDEIAAWVAQELKEKKAKADKAAEKKQKADAKRQSGGVWQRGSFTGSSAPGQPVPQNPLSNIVPQKEGSANANGAATSGPMLSPTPSFSRSASSGPQEEPKLPQVNVASTEVPASPPALAAHQHLDQRSEQ